MSEAFKPCHYCGWHQDNCLRQVESLESQLRAAVEGLERIEDMGCECATAEGCGYCLDRCNIIAEKTLATIKNIKGGKDV